jgi:hypothetical protein
MGQLHLSDCSARGASCQLARLISRICFERKPAGCQFESKNMISRASWQLTPRMASCQLALRICALAALVCCGVSTVEAQLPQARLLSIFPCGGKAGTTVELTLTGGTDLDEVNRLVFDHPGITAVPRTHDVGGRKEPVPNVFDVTIRRDVPSGVYEVYAGGLFGLSNPRIFVVGSQNESRETEPNNDPDKPNELVPDRIVNGVIGGDTDVDIFRFQGKRGQHIVATCRAADLDSRLSAVIELLGADGRRLAYAREERRHDPMVDVILPEDGRYLLKVHDFLFRGGPEYVYRLSAGSLPYIDYVMPPAGVPGTTGTFTLFGRNLPGGQPARVTVEGRPLEKLEVEISLPSIPPVAPAHTTLGSVAAGVKVVSWVLKTPAGESNPVLIQLAPSVPVIEKEPNDTAATAQAITAPGEFAGQFQSPGDTDYLTFHANAGQVFYIDVFADRVRSTADPYLVLEQVVRDAKGKASTTRITSMDDDNSNIAPAVFDTRTDDPTYRFQVPADGTYGIQLRDRSFESRGDPRMVYRVSIRPEEPDFQLVVLPQYPKQGSIQAVSTWALGLRKGDSRDVQILVLRKDGFREPIEVWAEDLPHGVSCRGAALASNAKTAELIFTAAENAPECSRFIRVFGKSRLSDRAKVSALAAADAALKTVADAARKVEKVAAATARAARKADELVATIKEAAEVDPANADLAKSLLAARSAASSTSKAAHAAAQSLAAIRKKLDAAQAAQRAAAAAAVPVEIVHEAIPATIVWSAALDVSAVSRIGQSLALSVMKESAPFQLSTDVARVDVNQSRQVLLPLTLARRNGFDGDVPLTLVGATPGSLDLQIKSFPKGKSAELVRLFVPRPERPGTVTLYWKTQAQVAYRRNPFAQERAKTEQAAAMKEAAEAAAAAQNAAGELALATKKQGQSAETLKSAKAQLAAAQHALGVAGEAAKTAIDHRARLELALVEPAAVAEAAAKVAEFAQKSADEAAGALKSASEAAKAQMEVKAAAAAKVAAQARKAAEDAAAVTKASLDALAAADRTLVEVRTAVKKSAADAEAARESIAEAEAAAQAATESKQKAAARVMETAAKSRAAAALKTAADQKLAQATKAAAPQNLSDFAPSTPILLTIKPAPIDLKAVVPKGGTLKKGGKIAVKVNVKRRSGFAGPVSIGLPLPPGVAGVKAEPLTLPANKTDGVVAITADATATPGPLANMVLRAKMDFQGTAEVDAPISLKIAP